VEELKALKEAKDGALKEILKKIRGDEWAKHPLGIVKTIVKYIIRTLSNKLHKINVLRRVFWPAGPTNTTMDHFLHFTCISYRRGPLAALGYKPEEVARMKNAGIIG